MKIKLINSTLSESLRPFIIIGLLYCITSCGNNTETYTPKQFATVRDSVQKMAESIAKDISHEGPVAWLRYFENTPVFFMASEGRLVFPNSDSATNFIKNILVKSISKIELRWNNIQIDVLTSKLAAISANFHEDITEYSGKKIAENGYFTGIAEHTPQGWKLRNAHWSVIATR